MVKGWIEEFKRLFLEFGKVVVLFIGDVAIDGVHSLLPSNSRVVKRSVFSKLPSNGAFTGLRWFA